MTILNRYALILLILCGAAGSSARADERILAFDSRIQVQADGSMDVTETIRVRAEGQQINHGIYRDFPTDYRDRGGNKVHVAFEPRTLTRDGAREDFRSERHGNGVRVYFGSKDITLSPGEYSYAFSYHTNRQLGFFATHDELYWNVTGNGWDFPIDAASAEVNLPGAIATSALQLEAYTGVEGAKDKNYEATADAPSQARFRTTQALMPREGLTIVVGFPKGVVAEPSKEQRAAWFFADNAGVLALCGGLLLIFIWYLVQWLRVGRDPEPGPIFPRYEAPDGLTPSALRFIERMGWDERCVAADLVDAAVRGAIRINNTADSYRIERADAVDLPSREAQLIGDLLQGAGEFDLKRSNHQRISTAIKAHKKGLTSEYGDRYFNKNTRLVVIGGLLTLATVIGAVLLLGEKDRMIGGGFMLVWLGGWSLGVFALGSGVIDAWRSVASGNKSGSLGVLAALSVTLFALPFFIGEVVGLGALLMIFGIAFSIAIVVLLATNLLFAHLMKAPTIAGRKVLDQIEGLRLYLGVAERDELAAQKAPPLTTGEYQRMLPYALALGVEKNWTDQFAAAIGPAAAAAAVAAAGWYHGSSINNLGSFASGIGSSFGSAISSSSSAPGSSSGGGGGGSSGGGGGGGGGGGW